MRRLEELFAPREAHGWLIPSHDSPTDLADDRRRSGRARAPVGCGARRLRDERRAPAARGRAGDRRATSPRRSQPRPSHAASPSERRPPGRASSTSGFRTHGSPMRSARSSPQARRSGRDPRASPSGSRSRWCPRIRRDRSPSPAPGTGRTATRWRASWRSPGMTSSASTTTTTPARRWSASALPSTPCAGARSRRRTATTATTSPSSRRSTEIPWPR